MTKAKKIHHYTKRDYIAFIYLLPWILGYIPS